MDDDELITAIAAGDDTAPRELFSRHAPWLVWTGVAAQVWLRRHPFLNASCGTNSGTIAGSCSRFPVPRRPRRDPDRGSLFPVRGPGQGLGLA
jgi:hypothetical protein